MIILSGGSLLHLLGQVLVVPSVAVWEPSHPPLPAQHSAPAFYHVLFARGNILCTRTVRY